MEYENRLNRSSPERCYRIEGNCLKWEDINGNSDVIPFDKVASIQLQYAPLRGLENYYIFTLKTIDGRTIQFSNQHLVKKIGLYEDRSKDYRQFVVELHRSIANCNPKVHYIGGNKTVWILYIIGGIIILSVFIFIVVVSSLYLDKVNFSWILALKIGIVLSFIPLFYKYIKRGKPVLYDPLSIPEKLLPPED